MDEGSSRTTRWVPFLAGALGLLGGIGGAYIGGKVANEGQQKQFENQREAQLQDLLIAKYGKYLAAAQVMVQDFDLPNEARAEAKKAADVVQFSAAEAEVHLVASRELWATATAVREAFETDDPTLGKARLKTAQKAFIERAQQDINSVTG
jgi:hypothetical protein